MSKSENQSSSLTPTKQIMHDAALHYRRDTKRVVRYACARGVSPVHDTILEWYKSSRGSRDIDPAVSIDSGHQRSSAGSQTLTFVGNTWQDVSSHSATRKHNSRAHVILRRQPRCQALSAVLTQSQASTWPEDSIPRLNLTNHAIPPSLLVPFVPVVGFRH